MICEPNNKFNIAGFKFEKIDDKRIIQSVYLSDTLNGDCIAFSVSNDINVDKENLAKELVKYFRKDVNVILDMQNDLNNFLSGKIYIYFVGIKNE
jgi:hypothetical protein